MKAECLQKFYGLEGKESLEDYSENTDKLRKLIELFIINFILPQREISSKTEPF